MVTPAAKRQAVAHLCSQYEVSQRRACSAIGVDRTSVRYHSRRSDDGIIRARLRELATTRRRFGYRRLLLMIRGEGLKINHKKLRRLYAEERLQVRRRGGRKRALGTRAPMTLPQAPNQRWSLDFVSDTLTDSRKFRMLAVVDDFTRECIVLVADTSLSGARVTRELDTAIANRGRPLMIVSDNGTEFTSMAIDTAIMQEARQSVPARERVADRFSNRAAAWYKRNLLFEPEPHRLDDGLGAIAASREPVARRLTAYVGFYGIEFGDLAQRLGRDRRVCCLRDLVELAPCMAPTCGEHDVALARQGFEAGIAVDMEHALEVLQMGSWTLSSAVWREHKDCRRRLRPTPAALLAGINPETSGLRSSATGIEHRDRRVVGKQMV